MHKQFFKYFFICTFLSVMFFFTTNKAYALDTPIYSSGLTAANRLTLSFSSTESGKSFTNRDFSYTWLTLVLDSIKDETAKLKVKEILTNQKTLVVNFTDSLQYGSTIYIYAESNNSSQIRKMYGTNDGSWLMSTNFEYISDTPYQKYCWSGNPTRISSDSCIDDTNGVFYAEISSNQNSFGDFSVNSYFSPYPFYDMNLFNSHFLTNKVDPFYILNNANVPLDKYIYKNFIANVPIEYPTAFVGTKFQTEFNRSIIALDYILETKKSEISVKLSLDNLPDELKNRIGELGYKFTLSKAIDKDNLSEPIDQQIFEVSKLDDILRVNVPLSQYIAKVEIVPKSDDIINKYDFTPLHFYFLHDGNDKTINTKDYNSNEGGKIDVNPEMSILSSLASKFSNLLTFKLPENPITSLLKMFTPNRCVNIPITQKMLNAPTPVYCSWFSSDTRSILTPVFSFSATMLVVGFIIRWLSGNGGAGSLDMHNTQTNASGLRFGHRLKNK